MSEDLECNTSLCPWSGISSSASTPNESMTQNTNQPATSPQNYRHSHSSSPQQASNWNNHHHDQHNPWPSQYDQFNSTNCDHYDFLHEMNALITAPNQAQNDDS